ncbi:MAG: molybdopterin-dependent oxidoreductase [Bauldia sp.]
MRRLLPPNKPRLLSPAPPTRRSFIAGGVAAFGAASLAACNQLDRAGDAPAFRDLLSSAENLTRGSQRLLLRGQPLAREFAEADLSKQFKANGTTAPDSLSYYTLSAGFADWRLEVGGLVRTKLSLSLSELLAMPSRTQITRHDCVEGWSCIGKWKGTALANVLDLAGLTGDTRYIVFGCADVMEPGLTGDIYYYESIDLFDAFHPQTILAYEMNDKPLPVAHGAPLRLRVERQLGYKSAKYLMKIDAVASLAPYGEGKGGYWEDRGYEWYAGI